MIEDLFIKYYARLCVYATSILGDPTAAEDIVQNVFFNIISNIDESLEPNSISPSYLYKSVKNGCLKVIRKNDYHHKYLEYGLSENIEYGYDEKIIQTELTATLLNLLEDLPQGCSRILKMCYIDGLKNSEIAEQLNISIHTVKSQKNRGLALLKEKVSVHFLLSLLLFLKNN
jgi:RNA polymerase sigma-70 factor (ECF subfamily)